MTTRLATTGDLELTPHTDNPYRDPVPIVQLLHCLRNAVEGGDTGLVDGFLAAAVLRADDPDSFLVLTGTTITFGFNNRSTQALASSLAVLRREETR